MSESWITCSTWIPRGMLCENPIESNDSQFDALAKSLQDQMQLTDAQDDGLSSDGEDLCDQDDKEINNDDELMKALNMDAYSDDDVDESNQDALLDRFMAQVTTQSSNIEGLEDDDEDKEDNIISAQDSIILVGQTVPGQDDCFLEMYCYNNETNALYVHHDIQIPADPICIQYSNCSPHLDENQQLVSGNYAIVGMFTPSIEIWDLDILNPVEPVAKLGGYDQEAVQKLQEEYAAANAAKKSTKQTKGKKNQSKQPVQPSLDSIPLLKDSHESAILSLAWHPQYPSRLASSSADMTVKLWDLTTQQCVHTYTHHSDEIPLIQWNPSKPDLLLIASQNGQISVVNATENQLLNQFQLSKPTPVASSVKKVGKKLVSRPAPPASILETARWNCVNPDLFYIARTNGTIECFDISKPVEQNPVWIINAQSGNKPVTAMAFSTIAPNLFATVGEDQHVRIWDDLSAAPNATTNNKPSQIASRNVDVGRLFTINFDMSNQFVLACGGDAGCLAIWDLMENVAVNKKYKTWAEELGLGDQTLPEDHIQLQLDGKQSKGIGPGRLYREAEKEDYDESDLENDEDDEVDDGDYDDDDDDDDDSRMELHQ